MRPRAIAIQTADGWTLRASLWLPPKPRGGIVLGHAMLASRAAFDRPEGLAALLHARGFAVLNADLRGHGESAPLPAEGARWTLEDIALRDLPALLEALRAAVDGPLFGAGHSLFGNALLLAAARDRLPLRGFAGLAANLWLPSCTFGLRRRLRRAARLTAFAALAWPRGFVRGSLVGLGREAVPYAFLAQMRDWYLRDAWTAPDGFDYRAALAAVELPYLGLHSAADDACPPQEARAFLGPLRRWSQEVLPARAGVSHMGVAASSRARPLWEALARWMEERS